MQTGEQEGRLFEDFSPAAYEQWRREAQRLLKGESFEKRLLARTLEGITLKPIYFPEDLEGFEDIRILAEEDWAVAREEDPKDADDLVWIRGDAFHDAGADAVQELAFSIARAVERLRGLEADGRSPEEAAPLFRFCFSLGSRFFMEVAKLRAARRLWRKVLQFCGVSGKKCTMRIQGRTSRRTGTVFDPYVNLLRATTQAFSGAAGGADSLHVEPFDARIRGPDEFSRRLARNILHILRDEARLGHVRDPAGGSWYVERLTHDVARAAWTLFQEVERRGGMDKALANGFPQTEAKNTAARLKMAAALREHVIVGTNKYPDPSMAPVDFHWETPSDEDPFPLRRPAEHFERLRIAMERARREGKNLKVRIQRIGDAARYMPRLDFIASFFEVGGFEVNRDEENESEEDAAVIAICGLDADYEEGVPAVAMEKKKETPDACVVLAGRPAGDELAERYRKAGVDLFIHEDSDVLEVLYGLAAKRGVEP